MSALKWIVKEAKAIKKQYPKRFAKWTDYVAQASAIYAKKHKGKSPVGKKKSVKKKATKKVGAVKKSAKKVVRRIVTKKAIKKTATKVVRRKPSVSMHKDSNSHNVKISVMSGIQKDNLRRVADLNSTILMREGQYRRWLKMKKDIVANEGLSVYKNHLKQVRNLINELKQHKKELLKHI